MPKTPLPPNRICSTQYRFPCRKKNSSQLLPPVRLAKPIPMPPLPALLPGLPRRPQQIWPRRSSGSRASRGTPSLLDLLPRRLLGHGGFGRQVRGQAWLGLGGAGQRAAPAGRPARGDVRRSCRPAGAGAPGGGREPAPCRVERIQSVRYRTRHRARGAKRENSAGDREHRCSKFSLYLVLHRAIQSGIKCPLRTA